MMTGDVLCLKFKSPVIPLNLDINAFSLNLEWFLTKYSVIASGADTKTAIAIIENRFYVMSRVVWYLPSVSCSVVIRLNSE
jgi:hypothetical protein